MSTRDKKKENSLYLWTYHFCPPLNPTQNLIGSLNESLKQRSAIDEKGEPKPPFIYLPAIMAAMSSCTVPIGLMLKFSTSTLATFGDRNAGSVGPRRIPFTPKNRRAKHGHGLLLVPGDIVRYGQIVDVIQAEDFFEFRSNDGQGIGIVALPCVQHTWNATDVTEIQFVIAVLGATGRQDHGVLGQIFGHFSVIGTRLLPTITPGHDHKALDRAGLDNLNHLVGQG